MKIPCHINLDLGQNKAIVQEIIDRCAVSKDINEVGMQVNCIDNGVKFHILQFNSSRKYVAFAPGH
jgi:hypothetical protein